MMNNQTGGKLLRVYTDTRHGLYRHTKYGLYRHGDFVQNTVYTDTRHVIKITLDKMSYILLSV